MLWVLWIVDQEYMVTARPFVTVAQKLSFSLLAVAVKLLPVLILCPPQRGGQPELSYVVG